MTKAVSFQRPKIGLFLGAGASNGAGAHPDEKPSMGGDLFDKLHSEYSNSWGKIEPTYRDTFHEDFEVGLYEYILIKKDEAIPLLKDMMRYFAKFYIQNPRNNKYSSFVRKYKTFFSNGLFEIFTINYDLLFECALDVNDVKYHQFPFGSEESIRILKLHGSCNFIGMPPNLNLKRGLTMPAKPGYHKNDLIFGSYNVPVNPVNQRDIDTCLSKAENVPCASLYLKSKPSLVTPEFMKGLWNQYSEDVKSLDMMIIIGINPRGHDTHIWEPILQFDGDLILIGCERDLKKWRREYIPEKNVPVISYKKDVYGGVSSYINKYIKYNLSCTYPI